MRTVATVAGAFAIGGAGGAAVGYAAGSLFGSVIIIAATTASNTAAQQAASFFGLIGAAAGGLIGSFWLATLAASFEVITSAPQHALNLGNRVSRTVNRLAQGDVRPDTVKELIFALLGAYSLFGTVQGAVSVVRGAIFGAAPRNQ